MPARKAWGRSTWCRGAATGAVLLAAMALVEVERNGPVVRVPLNRPERHNALVPEMWQRMHAPGTELGHDETILAR